MAKGAFVFEWPLAEQQKVQQILAVNADMINDWRPVWDILIPNLRQRHSVTFRQERDPLTDEDWTELSEKYAAWKEKHYPGKRILELTGALRRAASKKGAPGQLIVTKKRGMSFGVDLESVYPAVHQTTSRTRKDGKPIRRGWLGLKGTMLVLYLKSAVDEVAFKKFKRVRGARVTRG